MIGMEGLMHWSRQSLTIEEQAKVRQLLQDHLEGLKESNGYALFRLHQETVTENK